MTVVGRHPMRVMHSRSAGADSGWMASPDRSRAMDHVVVVMFENRSFDNLLGRLYEPGEVESFEGVIGKDLSNPIPEWAEHGADRGVVPYGVAEGHEHAVSRSGRGVPAHQHPAVRRSSTAEQPRACRPSR